MSTHVELRGLVKRYAGAEAVAHIDLEVEPGTITAMLGPSGCGKTTTLKMIAGLIAPTYGDILFDGTPVTRTRAERRGAIMVFQSHLLFPYMSVADNVGFGLRMRGVDKATIRAKSSAMLERVGLGGLEARRPYELSGGQQQRVALARALVVEPRVLLLDEPLSNLDAHLREGMRALISDVQRELGLTTLVVTHDQEEAVVLADRVALMFDGRIEQVGAPADFYRCPATERAARFFGWTNLIPGRWHDGSVHTAVARFHVPPGTAGEGPATVAFRPDAVQLTASQGRLEATVEELVFLGDATRVILRAGDQRIVMLAQPDDAATLHPGQQIRADVPPEHIWVLARDPDPAAETHQPSRA